MNSKQLATLQEENGKLEKKINKLKEQLVTH